MDTNRKKELLQAYKDRKSEMGIVSFCCVPTGDNYILGVKDTAAALNGSRFQLEMGTHYNHALQQLWNEHGGTNFKISVLEVLPYDKDESKTDYRQDLDLLCACYLDKDAHMKKLK